MFGTAYKEGIKSLIPGVKVLGHHKPTKDDVLVGGALKENPHTIAAVRYYSDKRKKLGDAKYNRVKTAALGATIATAGGVVYGAGKGVKKLYNKFKGKKKEQPAPENKVPTRVKTNAAAPGRYSQGQATGKAKDLRESWEADPYVVYEGDFTNQVRDTYLGTVKSFVPGVNAYSHYKPQISATLKNKMYGVDPHFDQAVTTNRMRYNRMGAAKFSGATTLGVGAGLATVGGAAYAAGKGVKKLYNKVRGNNNQQAPAPNNNVPTRVKTNAAAPGRYSQGQATGQAPNMRS
jgi:hypothetical protein